MGDEQFGGEEEIGDLSELQVEDENEEQEVERSISKGKKPLKLVEVTEDVGEDSTGMKPLTKRRRKMREVQEKGDDGAARWTRKKKAVDEETVIETEERRQSVSKEEEEEKSISKAKKPVEVKEEVGEDSSEIKPLMKQRDSKRKMRDVLAEGEDGAARWTRKRRAVDEETGTETEERRQSVSNCEDRVRWAHPKKKNVVDEEDKARMEIEDRRHYVSKVSTSPLKRKIFTKKEVEIIREFFVKHICTRK